MRKSLGPRALGPCSCCSTSLTGISRRSLLSGIGATAVGATASMVERALPALADTLPGENTSLIDVHHHFAPPAYVAENRSKVSPAALDWTPQKALDAMDAEGVATAVLSLALPGVWFGDADAARRTSRLCNDYAADLARSRPGRFGLFPVVPLPDIDGSLREIEYAFDVLKANGIGIVTNYSDASGSKWLGNPAFTPVFEELNRRKAVVFVHPIVASCCQKLLPDVSPLVSEIPQDTTRAVTNLLFTGTFSRFRDIRFIFSHGGGDVPIVMGRLHDYAPKNIAETAPNGIGLRTRAALLRYRRHGLSARHRSADKARARYSDFIWQRQSVCAPAGNGAPHERARLIGCGAASNRPGQCSCAACPGTWPICGPKRRH